MLRRRQGETYRIPSPYFSATHSLSPGGIVYVWNLAPANRGARIHLNKSRSICGDAGDELNCVMLPQCRDLVKLCTSVVGERPKSYTRLHLLGNAWCMPITNLTSISCFHLLSKPWSVHACHGHLATFVQINMQSSTRFASHVLHIAIAHARCIQEGPCQCFVIWKRCKRISKEGQNSKDGQTCGKRHFLAFFFSKSCSCLNGWCWHWQLTASNLDKSCMSTFCIIAHSTKPMFLAKSLISFSFGDFTKSPSILSELRSPRRMLGFGQRWSWAGGYLSCSNKILCGRIKTFEDCIM